MDYSETPSQVPEPEPLSPTTEQLLREAERHMSEAAQPSYDDHLRLHWSEVENNNLGRVLLVLPPAPRVTSALVDEIILLSQVV